MATLIPKYDQGATGAVNRDFNIKLSETVSILDFGVNTVPGTTDMSSAATLALATGKSVFFPKGIYKFASTVNLTGFEGQIVFGEGPTNTYIYTPAAGVAAFATTAFRLVSIRDLAIFGVDASAIGLLLGTRGVNPGGAGATFANAIRVNNVRFANCAQGIYAFGTNGGSFRDCLFETCTIGLYVQPVGAGDCNANNFDNMYFYNCGTAFQFLVNADGGNNATENNFVGGIEASTTATFSVRGYANTFNVWLDSQSGAGAPTVNTLESNYYIIRNGGSTPMPTWGLSKAINFSGGNIADQNAWLTKPAANSGAVLVCSNELGATIQNNQVFGTSDNGQVLIKNTNAGAQGAVLLNCLLDVPIGYIITLVCAQNNTGIILQIPNNATWTYFGFAHNDVIFGTVAVGTTYTILKYSATTLVRLI